jgi:hypothetical protein
MGFPSLNAAIGRVPAERKEDDNSAFWCRPVTNGKLHFIGDGVGQGRQAVLYHVDARQKKGPATRIRQFSLHNDRLLSSSEIAQLIPGVAAGGLA